VLGSAGTVVAVACGDAVAGGGVAAAVAGGSVADSAGDGSAAPWSLPAQELTTNKMASASAPSRAHRSSMHPQISRQLVDESERMNANGPRHIHGEGQRFVGWLVAASSAAGTSNDQSAHRNEQEAKCRQHS